MRYAEKMGAEMTIEIVIPTSLVCFDALQSKLLHPGMKVSVGVDPLLGPLPVAGEIVGAGISLYIVTEAANLGVSYTTVLRMIAISAST